MLARRSSSSGGVWRAVAGLGLLAGCGTGGQTAGQGPALEASTGRAEQAFINGEDDRQEYFELTDPAEQALMEQSVVALVPAVVAEPLYQRRWGIVPTWGEANNLCPDEPFEDQPSAAFCSGVLVDWDLVLTSGHCVGAVPLRNLRIVFGYYFREPEELAVAREDVYRVRQVVAARNDDGAGERLDFAWLRLAQPVRPPHAPATLRAQQPGFALGDAIIAINAGGGVPLKLDAGARVRDLREGFADYFVADTDTSEGSSGGPAFDVDLSVIGTLARGAPDFVPTPQGCVVNDREIDPRLAREQFTYASRSVEGLCAAEPEHWLCDTSCEGACEVPPPPLIRDPNDGCSLSAAAARRSWPGGPALLALGAVLALRRRPRSLFSATPAPTS